MDKFHTKSTSSSSAVGSDIVLRETDKVRLLFRPMIVDNVHDSNAAINGTFVYQRKGIKDAWVDVPRVGLNTLKKGEEYHLTLHAEEVLRLHEELGALYKLHKREGVPQGNREYMGLSGNLTDLAGLNPDDLNQFLQVNKALGAKLVSRILKWATEAEDVQALVDRLSGLGIESLKTLNIAVGVSSLKAALELWQENRKNQSEEFWQKSLTFNSFVLEQAYAWPVTVIAEKAYVGGKNIFNAKGNIADFLVKNRLTGSAALIEIKTPTTKLLGREYRTGIYNVSGELSGAVLQVLTYKNSLLQDYHNLTRGQGNLFDAFDPGCAVIIGDAADELQEQEHRRSFELFRSQFPGVQIITFDELFAKTEKLINILESTDEAEVKGAKPRRPF